MHLGFCVALCLQIFYPSQAAEITSNDSELREMIKSLQEELDSLKQTTAHQNTLLQAQYQEMESLFWKSQSMNSIGFSARPSGNIRVEANQIAKFDIAESNVGGAYNTDTGIFTCPVSGLYFFGTVVYTGDSHAVLQLTKENSGSIGSFADLDKADQGANFYIVECNAGERVWCEQKNPGGGTVAFGREGVALSGFSGFLIALTGSK